LLLSLRMRAVAASVLCSALAALSACQRTPAPVNFIAEGKPGKLSDWHVVESDGKRLSLNAGVLPFDLNTPLFSDHAHKLRTVWMPVGQAATYREQEAFDFPVGTILSKTFYYPKVDDAATGTDQVRQTHVALSTSPSEGLDLATVRLIETRLLVRRDDGWIALPYVWNEAQTEAVLERTGDQKSLELVDGGGRQQRFTYVVPNENQCASCHVINLKNRVFTPIGPKARHLNRTPRARRTSSPAGSAPATSKTCRRRTTGAPCPAPPTGPTRSCRCPTARAPTWTSTVRTATRPTRPPATPRCGSMRSRRSTGRWGCASRRSLPAKALATACSASCPASPTPRS
jgi:hypothetical protein